MTGRRIYSSSETRPSKPANLRLIEGDAFDPASILYGSQLERQPRSPLLPLYYLLKPLVPRGLQLAMRRRFARLQAGRLFPAWPIEPMLVNRQHDRIRAELRRSGADRIPFINFWPNHKRFAFILTHDVEGPAGIDNIPRVLELEQRHGLVSSWNFVAEDYPIEEGLFDELRSSGCEIGLHGITHDGRLFQSRARFEQQLPAIHRYLREWGAVGFRAPSTHRNVDWMSELGCLYDSSFPDTDPFEPQPGGCCSILPFFLGNLVELPITMVQDHTLFEILEESSTRLWDQKSDWIIQHHGLVNVLVHPDYLLSDQHLGLYEQLLVRLSSRMDGWHALPLDVARWWAQRAGQKVNGLALPQSIQSNGEVMRATVAYAREEQGTILFDI